PYSNIAAIKKFKKKYSNILCIGYYLDLLNSMQKPKLMPKFLYNNLIRNENIASLKKLDANLVAIAGEQHYSGIPDKEIMNKLHFVDFPTFRSNNKELVISTHHDN